jgi:hypothetical protein
MTRIEREEQSINSSLFPSVNVALIAGLGFFAYKNKDNARSWDKRIVSAVSVGVFGLVGGQR